MTTKPTNPATDAEVTELGTQAEPVPEAADIAPELQPGELSLPVEDWHDRYLRLAAEFDNFRKRWARERGDLVRSAERDLIAELTEVLDSFERALESNHTGESAGHFAKGISLIRDQLWTALQSRGLERMETIGTPFDPEQHNALMRMPSDQHAEGLVMQEVSPGYRLGGKVLRHTRVIVSQGKPEPEASGENP